MGCDIHAYVEYRQPDQTWWHFGGRINPGRNYTLFGLMSKGVRAEFEESIPPKGLPSDIASNTRSDARLWLSESGDEEGHCTLEQAIRWQVRIYERDGKPYAADDPDFHSHSWLSVEEYEHVLSVYSEKEFWKVPEYKAILAAMKELRLHGFEVRLVFWFDN